MSHKRKKHKPATFAAKVAAIEARGIPHEHARAIAGASLRKGKRTKAERERERRALKRAKALHASLRR